MKIRLWKLTSASLSHECCIALIEFKPGKLFRTKMCLWLNSICFVNLLYKSEFSQLILLSSAVEGFTFFRLPPREAVWKVSNAPFCTPVDIPHLGASHWKLLNTRVHLGVCPFLLGMSVTTLCSTLGSNPAWQWSLRTSLVLLRISLFDWTYFWLKTATFEILINDKFPPEPPSLAAQIETQVISSETWVWYDQPSILRWNAYVYLMYSRPNALPFLSELCNDTHT